jgi:membrane protease YdiL (CAAX protease family)
MVDRQVVPLFADLSLLQLAAISLAAGFGEELLFRGVLQSSLSDRLGPPWGIWAGLLFASVIFGMCHWLTFTYALLATLIGVYLGTLLLVTENLLAPIVSHALYDFVALIYMVRWDSNKRRD